MGSELQRKAATILSIEKDDEPTQSVVKALKVRDGSPLDVPLMLFAWDKETGMHVYKGEKPRKEKGEAQGKRTGECRTGHLRAADTHYLHRPLRAVAAGLGHQGTYRKELYPLHAGKGHHHQRHGEPKLFCHRFI